MMVTTTSSSILSIQYASTLLVEITGYSGRNNGAKYISGYTSVVIYGFYFTGDDIAPCNVIVRAVRSIREYRSD